ncbi:DR2241 family protein [Natronorubrum daqingense]|uniref:Uncharacterized protein n=1 Tax=Natronorubrum daqingense TaxID=588898 RepID=A0A1N6YF95_9EURY|nr:DR2241 family protein [Natronorubrum daqingense]APX95686.1 hypothetical protein BB347_03110 [Natronorubrum daqingense]SIR13230.1 hypothetical protein SAMN05421809_0423 [Natronorubrum daqingense]
MDRTSPEFEAVLETVTDEERIAFDGLTIERDGDTYTVETPAGAQTGLERSDLPQALEPVSAYVTNWYYWQRTVGGEDTARRAFLRWCERAPIETEGTGADEPATSDASTYTNADDGTVAVPARDEALRDGIDREWGELVVTTRLVDDVDRPESERVYDCWHVADAGTDLAELEVYDDPRAARELATHDEDGRYRPLKTAPTLVSGWAFTGLSGAELVDTIGFFYPATVANWHREQRDALDVDHWAETADRQSGIYDVVDELPREAVEWMTEACCVDSQCLRRREWHFEEDDELAVDGGDGQFPCREPCSLVIAAARSWAILESEDEHTYELELTTSELNQLTEIVDAVADGRTDEIREADVNDGANRFRARYLRAKRFDDDGGFTARRRADETDAD